MMMMMEFPIFLPSRNAHEKVQHSRLVPAGLHSLPVFVVAWHKPHKTSPCADSPLVRARMGSLDTKVVLQSCGDTESYAEDSVLHTEKEASVLEKSGRYLQQSQGQLHAQNEELGQLRSMDAKEEWVHRKLNAEQEL